MFPLLIYGIEERTLLKKTVPTAMIYTMNCPEGLAERFHYPTLLGANADALERTFGYSETLCAYDTYQFSDYSRYEVSIKLIESKIEMKRTA